MEKLGVLVYMVKFGIGQIINELKSQVFQVLLLILGVVLMELFG